MKHPFHFTLNRLFAGLLLFLLLSAPLARAQAPAWQMAQATEQAGSYYSHMSATATDASGNVYVTGSFTGTATFGTTTLTSPAGAASYVAKWSPASNTYVWALLAGGTSTSPGGANTTDVTGIAVSGTSIYIAGNFGGATATLGNIILTNANTSSAYGGIDMFVAKLTDAGATASFTWAQQAGGDSNDIATGLAVNGSNVYVTGWFSSLAARFGSTVLAVPNNGLAEVFVAKLTDAGAAGSFTWAQQAGGTGGDIATAVAVSGPNVYITGYFNSPAAVFGSTTLANTNPLSTSYFRNSDVFVAKLTDAGPTASFTWAQQAGGAAYDLSMALAVNGSNIYIAGYFGSSPSSLSPNLGSTPSTFGTTTITNVGDYDAFVSKLTDAGSTGSFTWTQRAGGTSADSATAIAVRGNRVYVAGTFRSAQASFGATAINNTGAGSNYRRDLFVTRLTDTGTTSSFDWTQQAGGAADDFAAAIAVSGTTVYVGGATGPPASFSSQAIAAPTDGQVGFLASLPDPTLTATTSPALAGSAFSLFPNPARSSTTVQLPALPGTAAATLTLRDALGRAVRTATVALPAAGLRHEFDLSGLPAGIYALQVQAGAATATRRLVVE